MISNYDFEYETLYFEFKNTRKSDISTDCIIGFAEIGRFEMNLKFPIQ